MLCEQLFCLSSLILFPVPNSCNDCNHWKELAASIVRLNNWNGVKRWNEWNERNALANLTWLETYCLPVAAWIAGGEVAAVELPDHLAAAELVVVVHRHDAVAAALQLLE